VAWEPAAIEMRSQPPERRSETPKGPKMNSKTMFLSLIPWVLFTVIAGHGGTGFVGPAALIATVLAAGIALKNSRGSNLKVIDASGIVTFGALTVIGFAGSDAVRQHVIDYGRAGSALVLAAVMLGSLLFVPFTEQYAREATPKQYWNSPVFRAVNRRISALWGGAILVMAGSHFVSGHLEAAGNLTNRDNLVLNWVIPVLLVLGAMKLTGRIVGEDSPATTSV
jgi:hypothetical protein